LNKAKPAPAALVVASGLISSREDNHVAHARAGQLLERVWLTATALGLNIQPMGRTMQIPEIRAHVAGLFPKRARIPQQTLPGRLLLISGIASLAAAAARSGARDLRQTRCQVMSPRAACTGLLPCASRRSVGEFIGSTRMRSDTPRTPATRATAPCAAARWRSETS
jgi:hypothetical protein